MSDVDRPTPPNKPNTPGNTPVRNMADIAKLFLDGARPGANGAPAPRRVPPAAAQTNGHTNGNTSRPSNREEPFPAAMPPATDPLKSSLLLALALPTQDPKCAQNAWRLLSAAAAGLSHEQSTTVALAGIQVDKSGRPQFVIDIHGAESPEDLPSCAATAGVIDLQLAQAVYRLKSAVGLWLLALPDPDAKGFTTLATRSTDWLLACTTDNAGLVSAYQHFKKSWILAQRAREGGGESAAPAHAPSVFLLARDFAQAAVVHQRMRKAAQEFLKTDLRLAGISADTESAAVRVLSLPAAGGADGLWHALLDELAPASHAEHEEAHDHYEDRRPLAPLASDNIEDVLDHVSATAEDISRHSAATAGMVLDHLAQVLDPEEREALSASFDDPEPEPPPAPAPRQVARAPRTPEPEPAFDIRSQVSGTLPPAVITMPTEPAKPAARAPVTAKQAPPAPAAIPAEALPQKPVGVTLRAFDVLDSQDESRLSQWAAVERSVRDLVPGSILLDARPPMSWATESCIAIDPEGNLHIWTLYKDGASWFALREWANEHRNLLALTRRDLVISKDSPVNVHIVLPLDAVPDQGDAPVQAAEKPADIINTIMRTPAKNIHLYRLRVLTWNARRGLLVVPIA